MMEIIIILQTLSVIGICVFIKFIIGLNKHIIELEKRIDALQHQTDDILCDVNIVNLHNTCGLLTKMEYDNGEKVE